MAEPSTQTGTNRTGIRTSPFDMSELEEIASKTPARDPEDLRMTAVRANYAKESDGIGSVPPPASLKGMAASAMELIQGHKPTVLIDRLGERLAFERMGVRLYESLLIKFDALGTWDGGPTREILLEQYRDELSHFKLMNDTLERIGADPTAMTPAASLTAVEGSGLLKVIVDPRTTLPQALHALLLAESADVEGWGALIDIADSISQNDLATQFREAERTEQLHQQRVREWLLGATRADAHRDLETGATTH
jgi:hypothetical protein